jgi:hypothetical protein
MNDSKRAVPDLTKACGRKVEFDYLRAFAVILVLFHHAVIAYMTSASINLENPIATASPVADEQRWLGFDLMVAFNETYFMPLLFFISGMFVWKSLSRKGAFKYLVGRLKRLGYPFVIGVLFLMPIAYYPAQLQVGGITGVDFGYGSFWIGMIRSGFGTAGPLWFLWLLLAFNCLAALLYRCAPNPQGLITGRSTVIHARPVAFLGLLLGASMAGYLPMVIIFGPLTWYGIGPFNAQVSRILLYLVYFLAGTATGAYGFKKIPSRLYVTLSRRWWGWVVVSLISFVVFVVMAVLTSFENQNIIREIAFVICCWATIFGMIGIFLRFAKRRICVLDNLSENSYGIYVVHYVFVTWLQYLLLESALSPSMKGMVVFVGTFILSWGSVAAIRCIPPVAKVI